ncbi:hypothetical protein AMAG_18600 [Allomyces macrogynus ATCC 38327]|uniref:Prenyltransferase alpha-alpha toroid domain-containing protein n=1 Tax=Allomyces macrogynus (strain ATCC 38327) TaxID=578462 RepID=A0A0L0SED2_ALLM3|nr:hypothetical protein AMAG_18600 [Allomyces macrogynus ATCC 38327]|eukprot:KNE60750.1 hypothetical protein AMAG_18600 [Allomyces macrogynus ATCC 38327]
MLPPAALPPTPAVFMPGSAPVSVPVQHLQQQYDQQQQHVQQHEQHQQYQQYQYQQTTHAAHDAHAQYQLLQQLPSTAHPPHHGDATHAHHGQQQQHTLTDLMTWWDASGRAHYASASTATMNTLAPATANVAHASPVLDHGSCGNHLVASASAVAPALAVPATTFPSLTIPAATSAEPGSTTYPSPPITQGFAPSPAYAPAAAATAAYAPNDTCYSFWIGASLAMLDALDLIDPDKNALYLCSQRTLFGGLSKDATSPPALTRVGSAKKRKRAVPAAGGDPATATTAAAARTAKSRRASMEVSAAVAASAASAVTVPMRESPGALSIVEEPADAGDGSALGTASDAGTPALAGGDPTPRVQKLRFPGDLYVCHFICRASCGSGC